MIARIAFLKEVPTPRSPSFARTNWIASFDVEQYAIAREADTVKITSRETGATFHYPWSNVAAYELLSPARPVFAEPPGASSTAAQKPKPKAATR